MVLGEAQGAVEVLALDVERRDLAAVGESDRALQREVVRELGVVKTPYITEPKPWTDEFESRLRSQWRAPLGDAMRTTSSLMCSRMMSRLALICGLKRNVSLPSPPTMMSSPASGWSSQP